MELTAAIALELRALREEVAALAEVQDHLVRRLLAREDQRAGSCMVPLLGDLFADEAFTATDLAARALNGRDAESVALREMVSAYCTERGGLRSLGRALARLEGVSFEGSRLVSAGEARGVRRWRVSGRP